MYIIQARLVQALWFRTIVSNLGENHLICELCKIFRGSNHMRTDTNLPVSKCASSWIDIHHFSRGVGHSNLTGAGGYWWCNSVHCCKQVIRYFIVRCCVCVCVYAHTIHSSYMTLLGCPRPCISRAPQLMSCDWFVCPWSLFVIRLLNGCLHSSHSKYFTYKNFGC